jgi:hypothetical protein
MWNRDRAKRGSISAGGLGPAKGPRKPKTSDHFQVGSEAFQAISSINYGLETQYFFFFFTSGTIIV